MFKIKMRIEKKGRERKKEEKMGKEREREGSFFLWKLKVSL